MNKFALTATAALLMASSASALPSPPRSSVTVDAIGSGGYQATYITRARSQYRRRFISSASTKRTVATRSTITLLARLK